MDDRKRAAEQNPEDPIKTPLKPTIQKTVVQALMESGTAPAAKGDRVLTISPPKPPIVPQPAPPTQPPVKLYISDYWKRRVQTSSWAEEVEISDTPPQAPPFQEKFHINDETMILILEATQHNKNPTIKTIMDMITVVMTEKEKGVKKLDPISNRVTDTNNRRTFFLSEFTLHLRKLLLQELGADSGLINVYPLKHLILDKDNPTLFTPNNAAHSDEERVIINKLTTAREENDRTKLRTAWFMLFSVTYNVLRAHSSPSYAGTPNTHLTYSNITVVSPYFNETTTIISYFREGPEKRNREINKKTLLSYFRLRHTYPTLFFQKK